MDPLDFQKVKIKCILKNKKFISISMLQEESCKIINLKLNDIFIPFGPELYNDKYIINLEFEKNNNLHNNYLSFIQSLENKIINKQFYSDINIDGYLINKTFYSSIKESKLGNILRSHLMGNTEIFILKKDGGKYNLDKENLKGVTANIEIGLKGIWINDNNYGFYWNINVIQITKFN
jgi:hypothetical protein